MENNQIVSSKINEQRKQNENRTEGKTVPNVESNNSSDIPYPRRVFLILGNEFCERFTYYGMVGILSLYLKNKLGYTENDATIVYHGFSVLVYSLGIPGSIISDVWLGKFRTILYLSIVYAIGSIVVSISAIPTIDISPKTTLIVGLLLIAIGSGGIKPCVSAFGGDQFELPKQAVQLATFFSILYFSNNFGGVITSAVTPILRADVHCFGQNDCYSLAFGVPAILMIISIFTFVAGKSSYTYEKMSSENMLIQVSKCVANAISIKISGKHSQSCKNLLDYSVKKYGEELVNDIKILLRLLVLYLPLPLFWALFSQKGSRWLFQGEKMNGQIGYVTVKPDQMQIINPVLVLILIPLFEVVINPILSKIGLGRQLPRMAIGGVLAAISFLFAAFVQFKIETSPPNSVSILWLLPQYVVITIGETMLSPTGLAFSYEQAPQRMKSVVQGFWQLTVAFGNLITMIFIANFKLFDSLTYEFVLFAGLMIIDVLIFMILAYYYKSNSEPKKSYDQNVEQTNVNFKGVAPVRKETSKQLDNGDVLAIVCN